MLDFLKREIAIMQKIQHPNVVKLLDVARTNNYIYMFLEYCADGDIKSYIEQKKEKRLSEVTISIFYSLKARIDHLCEAHYSRIQESVPGKDHPPGY